MEKLLKWFAVKIVVFFCYVTAIGFFTNFQPLVLSWSLLVGGIFLAVGHAVNDVFSTPDKE